VLKVGGAFAPIKLLSTTGAHFSRILGATGSECIICGRGQVADLQRICDSLPRVRYVLAVARPGQRAGEASTLEVTRYPGSGTADGRAPARPMPGADPMASSDWANHSPRVINQEGIADRHCQAREGGEVWWRNPTACVLIENCGDSLSTSAVTHAELAGVF